MRDKTWRIISVQQCAIANLSPRNSLWSKEEDELSGGLLQRWPYWLPTCLTTLLSSPMTPPSGSAPPPSRSKTTQILSAEGARWAPRYSDPTTNSPAAIELGDLLLLTCASSTGVVCLRRDPQQLRLVRIPIFLFSIF